MSSPIKMEIYLKPTISSDFFVPFLEFTSNFEHFETKDDCQSDFISEISDSERLGSTTFLKTTFQNTL